MRSPVQTQRIRWARWACVLSSLVLGLLYVRSAFHPGVAGYGPFGYVGVTGGRLVVHWWPMPPPGSPRVPLHVGNLAWNPPGMRWWFEFGGVLSGRRACIPLWVPLVPTLALSGLLGRRGASFPGACRACGYDLKGTASGRCPECGAGGAGPSAAIRPRRTPRGWPIG